MGRPDRRFIPPPHYSLLSSTRHYGELNRGEKKKTKESGSEQKVKKKGDDDELFMEDKG